MVAQMKHSNSIKSAEHRNGCWGREPFVDAYRSSAFAGGEIIENFSDGEPCRYTLSDLGAADKGCTGCARKQEVKREG